MWASAAKVMSRAVGRRVRTRRGDVGGGVAVKKEAEASRRHAGVVVVFKDAVVAGTVCSLVMGGAESSWGLSDLLEY